MWKIINKMLFVFKTKLYNSFLKNKLWFCKILTFPIFLPKLSWYLANRISSPDFLHQYDRLLDHSVSAWQELHTMAEETRDDQSFPLSQKTKHGRNLWETCSLVKAHQKCPPSWVWKEGEPWLYLHLPGRERLERMSSPSMTSLQRWK